VGTVSYETPCHGSGLDYDKFHKETRAMKPKSSHHTIERVVLPIEIFDDPTSADAIMLTRPNAVLADEPGERCSDQVTTDSEKRLDK